MKKITSIILVVMALMAIGTSASAEWIYGKTFKGGIIQNYYHHKNGKITNCIITKKGNKLCRFTNGKVIAFSTFDKNNKEIITEMFFPNGCTARYFTTKNGAIIFRKIFKGIITQGILKNGIAKGVNILPDGTKIPFTETDS